MKPSVHARCEKTEAEANKAKAEAAEIAADAQKDLNEALPALEVTKSSRDFVRNSLLTIPAKCSRISENIFYASSAKYL